MPQQSVEFEARKGFEGMCGSGVTSVVRSAIGEETNGMTVPLPYGRVVVAGTDAGQLVLPTTAGETPLGISALNTQWGVTEADMEAGIATGFPVDAPVGRATRGDWWVYAEGAVAVGDDVFYRHTLAAAPNDQAGRVTNATSAEHDAFPNAKFITSTDGPGLALINLGGDQ